jgi:hypothetical protein
MVSSPIWDSWPDSNYCFLLTLLNSVISYIAGECGCFYCCVTWCLLCRAHPLPSNCCVILVTRHTLLLRGRIATVVNKRHITCSVHVTSTVAWSPSNGCKQTPYCLQHARHNTKTLHSAHKVYLCVSYDSQNKQRLFPQAALTSLFCSGDVMCFLWGTNWILIYGLEEIRSLKG